MCKLKLFVWAVRSCKENSIYLNKARNLRNSPSRKRRVIGRKLRRHKLLLYLGIIHLVRRQNILKTNIFPPDPHTYVCVSGGKKCYIFRKILRTC